MALERCEDCGKMHYRTNPCAQMIAKKSGNSRAAEPAVVPRAQSTAARKDVQATEGSRPLSDQERERDAADVLSILGRRQAGVQALPVDTIPKPKMGRPRIHPDRRAYLTMKQREYREKKRAAK